MADHNVEVTPGDGATVGCDLVDDDGLDGEVFVQYVKLMDGTLEGSNKAVVSDEGSLQVEGPQFPGEVVLGKPVLVAGLVSTGVPSPLDHRNVAVPWLDPNQRVMVATALKSQRWHATLQKGFADAKSVLIAGTTGTSLQALTLVFTNMGAAIQTHRIWQGSSGPLLLQVFVANATSLVVNFDPSSPLEPATMGADLYYDIDSSLGTGQVWAWGTREPQDAPLVREAELLASSPDADRLGGGRGPAVVHSAEPAQATEAPPVRRRGGRVNRIRQSGT